MINKMLKNSILVKNIDKSYQYLYIDIDYAEISNEATYLISSVAICQISIHLQISINTNITILKEVFIGVLLWLQY